MILYPRKWERLTFKVINFKIDYPSFPVSELLNKDLINQNDRLIIHLYDLESDCFFGMENPFFWLNFNQELKIC